MGFLRNVRKGFMYLSNSWQATAQDLALLDRYLTAEERRLFEQMDPPDRRHSFRVANFCIESMKHFPEADEELLMRTALLHDVGKIGGNLGLIFRTFWVFGHKGFGWLLNWVARRSGSAPRGSLRQKMWLQLNHARLGAEMLRQMGEDEALCDLVDHTGQYRDDSETIEQRIIIAADGDRVLRPETVDQ